MPIGIIYKVKFILPLDVKKAIAISFHANLDAICLPI
jgi:hypothetical protein